MKYSITQQDKALIALTTQTRITNSKLHLIIDTLDDVSVIFSDNFDIYLKGVVTTKDINSINSIDIEVLESYLKELERKNIEVFTYLSDIYPKNLKEISSSPIVLYAKGNLDLLKEYNTLAVVGTRRASNYGEEVAKSFSRVLAKNGVCIISGLADGIDSVAHKGTLDSKGKTIAVLGSGFDYIYPATNIGLAKDIVDNNGLLLTEYMPSETPQNFHFPARNRIVAGLSKAVLIVEAPARSGALITKEIALDCNRDIFVVPGRVTDVFSRGSNEVIKSCQGSIVLSVDDILEYFGQLNTYHNHRKCVQLSMEEEIVYDILAVNDEHYEVILARSGMQPSQLNSLLMQMELKNIVKRLPGNIYTSTKI